MVDAVVVGAGPNGLAAAVTLARAGLSVEVVERNDTIGGGARTAELTLPGFLHDVCSAVHPMALQSEFFRRFRMEERIELRLPEVQYGHPLDGGRAGIAYQDLERTAAELGVDGPAFRNLMGPLARAADQVADFATDALLHVPRHPLTVLRFGLRALEQGSSAWNARFRQDAAPAMVSGVAAHSIQHMPSLSTAAAALSLGAYAHARGWPVPIGGSQAIIDALADDLVAHGGRIVTGHEVRSLGDLTPAKAVLFDTSVPGMLRIAGSQIPTPKRGALRRFRFGNAAAKVDFALSDPVPWTNEALRRAGTVHIGGTRAEIAAAEGSVAHGQHAERPYVLGSEPTVVDPTRAPKGKHVFWAYAHVPAGSDVDQTEAITRQVERFAPGFRDTILHTSSRTAAHMSDHNPNYVGGDIAAGAASFWQLVKRPVLSSDPWRMGGGMYLCSESSAPGPGVHGMAGWRAAKSALRHTFGLPDDVDLTPEG
ncbi:MULTISPECIES: NAD(P)/FAD-dependent oxidoreductase [unclassified Curtobacterium]|uniref:phytoene desaturase family protein n=1 Tax=unclassified Curtobacterium TaxID=257496 RepID=UPI001046696F|nr:MULTISPECIES: NAD(P)/FAD-dependent oxidoreductase [unclassified Curtobacterium]TCL79847.1 phytoene dehydrogenase-like protein [Curtobacterium sp. PhB128]TCL97979.1 phytoene dehydrogenase-like protein [Curtobacterium sp. PhB138]